MAEPHKWMFTDDIVAYYYYCFKGDNLKYTTTSDISASLGMSKESFEARVETIVSIKWNDMRGLSNATNQTRNVVALLEPSRESDEKKFQSILSNIINDYL